MYKARGFAYEIFFATKRCCKLPVETIDPDIWKEHATETMKTRLPKRIVPRDQGPSCSSAAAAHLIYDFRGVAWGLLLGKSFASTKQIVRGIVKGGPALRASMFIILLK